MTSDVLVIGGGIIGGTIAWRLAQAGAAVRVLEAGVWGGKASWAGAGMLAPGGEVEQEGDAARLAMDGRAEYGAFVEELRAASGVAIDYRDCGALELAASESEEAALRERMERQRGFGIDSEWLTGAEARERLPELAGAWQGGAWYAGDAVVHPRELMRALREVCEKSGVRVRESAAVSDLVCVGSRVEARTAAGEVYAGESAVLAAGAWSSHVKVAGAGTLVESIPVQGHLVRYEMPAGWLRPILRHRNTYLFQRNSGALIAGATSERVGFRDEVDPACLEDVRGRAARLLPSLGTRDPVEAWAGLRPASAQSDPVVGRLAGSRLWAAYGHYRNGILMAPSTARRVAGEITSSWGTA